MLDQNTDRMWYVIGAIVIGGLILTGSIVLFTDVAFAGVQDTFSMFSNMVDVDENMDDMWFDGATMIYDTNDFSFLYSYSGAKHTKYDNQRVDEWGVNDATRIISTGGTNRTKLLKGLVPFSEAVDGRDYLYTFKIKNDGEFPINFTTNTVANRTKASVTIEPGGNEIVYLSVKKSNSTNIHFQIQTLRKYDDVDQDMDIYLHGFKFGYRD